MLKTNSYNMRFTKLILGLLDIAATVGVLILSIFITNNTTSFTVDYTTEVKLIFGILVLCWIILLKATHLARIPRTSSYSIIFIDFLRLSLVGGAIILTADWLITIDNFPAVTIVTFMILNTLILFCLRVFTFKYFKSYRANGHNLRNVIIMAGNDSDKLIEKIYSQKEWGFRILCVITDSDELRKTYRNIIKVYPSAINIKSIVQYDIVDEIICLDCVNSENKIYELIDFCKELGVTVRLKSIKKLNLPFSYKSIVSYFGKVPFYTIENNPNNNFSHIVKHITEMVIAFLLLFVLSPLLLLVAFLIAFTSKGPVVFKQARVGLHGRKFYIYKFRTMVQNAEELKVKLAKMNESDGPAFKIKNDPRITRIGKFLRKTSLDEVPQLFNVVKGEMSIIGPRPPLPKEVDQYERWQLKRLSVKPGLTCTWQIVPNRNDVNFESWMHMDIHYIDNWSLGGDVRLFFKTFKTVISARSY